MKKVPHNKVWLLERIPVHIEPPNITLIKYEMDTKSEKCYTKIKLRRNTHVKYIGCV